MRTVALGAALATVIAVPALAQYSKEEAQDQREIADAKAVYDRDLRAHDEKAVARDRERLRQAYAAYNDDKQAMAEAAKPAPPGVPREVYEHLVRARDAYRDALASGDRGRIIQARQALRDAYHQEGVYAHHRNG